jgi:hypothetical protein
MLALSASAERSVVMADSRADNAWAADPRSLVITTNTVNGSYRLGSMGVCISESRLADKKQDSRCLATVFGRMSSHTETPISDKRTTIFTQPLPTGADHSP